MFSIIIPTYNRAVLLNRSVRSLLQIPGIAECEVLIINDGSTDNTAEVLASLKQMAPHIVIPVTLPNGGPAQARNYGVRAASHERILFIDDDVFPRSEMLQQHTAMLDNGYDASQGLLRWHPDIPISPLIHYIDSCGSQFAFDKVTDPYHLTFPFIYTGNLAVIKTTVLEVGGFDESFTFSACEDTVLGYKLQQHGTRMALNIDAIADHLHHMTETEFLMRERRVGYFLAQLRETYPVLARALRVSFNDTLLMPQRQILSFINSLPLIARLLTYDWSMKLRHREAFVRGFLDFTRRSTPEGLVP